MEIEELAVYSISCMTNVECTAVLFRVQLSI